MKREDAPTLRSGSRQDFRPSCSRDRENFRPCRGPKLLTSSARCLAAIASLFVSVFAFEQGHANTSRNRPNVVVLLADDLGSKDLGCYGGPVKTPVLDGLASRGVRFTDFHAGAAVCSPSRATLITGRQNLRTGIYGVLQDHWHNMHLLEREVTIAEVLQ